MNVIIEALSTILFVLYSCVEYVVLFFVPSSWRYKDIKGQRVLITGAGSGIGRLMAHKFAKHGCSIALWDINKSAVQETADELQQYGIPVYNYLCDVSKREDVYKVAEQVKVDMGDIDILVNNAGIATGKKLLECPDDRIIKAMEVNTMAHFWTLKAFLPSMMERNSGHIVTIASAAGMFAVNGIVDYCASKFAALGLHESLSFELTAEKKHGINTTLICPYYINTGMFAGVSDRFPWIMSMLEPDYVVDRIMTAILTKKEVLLMPRLLYIFLLQKCTLPSKAFLAICQFMGVDHSMDNYVGRSKSE